MSVLASLPIRRWLVIGPEYGVIDRILDDGTGPLEYSCDVVEVEAGSKRDARRIGVQLLRQIHRGYLQRYPDENPFAGVKVEPILEGDDDECPTRAGMVSSDD